MKGLGSKAHSSNAKITESLKVFKSDLTRIRQVLFNLLSNAAKFTENGTITLATKRVASPEGDKIVFTVEDSGVGIPSDELASIFDEFVQVRRGLEHRPHGTGLGLAICRRIVRALGGRITVDSTEGRGTVFAVHLPMWPEEDHE